MNPVRIDTCKLMSLFEWCTVLYHYISLNYNLEIASSMLRHMILYMYLYTWPRSPHICTMLIL